ncbi:hypothetical protein D3C76_1452030 [compost metagenome]
MGGITQQEGPLAAEVLRHPMMYTVGGKPVDLLDLDLEVFDGALADVFETQLIGVFCTFVAYGAYQPRPAAPRQGKDREEVRFVNVDMQLAIECRA